MQREGTRAVHRCLHAMHANVIRCESLRERTVPLSRLLPSIRRTMSLASAMGALGGGFRAVSVSNEAANRFQGYVMRLTPVIRS